MKAPNTTSILDFLQRQSEFVLDRREVGDPVFGDLRRGLRRIVVGLRESGNTEAEDIADRVRVLLSEWLTVPLPFTESMVADLQATFEGSGVPEGRWGADIQSCCLTASRAAEQLVSLENPLREMCRAELRGLRAGRGDFRIYCHRRAKSHFTSMFEVSGEEPITDAAFLHSLREYREACPFGVLIKVGPLRARGWGAAPDAILSAPRYGRLAQFVWAGCGDEPQFGLDPLLTPAGSTKSPAEVSLWIRRVSRSGVDPGGSSEYLPQEDELRLFRELVRTAEPHAATLVQLEAGRGILYPPAASILSFDPSASPSERVAHRTPAETLLEGMFVIMPILDDTGLGGVHARHGYFSQAWKARLDERWHTNPSALVAGLRTAGLRLLRLDAAVRHWLTPPTTVIHAPQQKAHFEILLRVLDLIDASGTSTDGRGTPFLKLAWNEIRRSRGEAIRAGVLENEIIDEQLCAILVRHLPELDAAAAAGDEFSFELPEGQDLAGQADFHVVCGIETDFRAPETEFKVVNELGEFDRWRD